MNKCRPFVLITVCISVLVGFSGRANAQYAHLTLQGETGSLIGDNSYDITYTLQNTFGQFDASIYDYINGQPDLVVFSFSQFDVSNPQSLDYDTMLYFGTDQLGIGLTPGVYSDAQRALFAQPGHPGLDVSFNHGGFNTLTGQFVVADADFTPIDNTPFLNISYFSASFEEQGDGLTPLTGTFTYSANDSLVIPESSSSTFVLMSIPILFGAFWQRIKCKNRGSVVS